MDLFKQFTQKRSFNTLCIIAFMLFTSAWEKTYATSTGMPWETILDKIMQSLSGPVARLVIIIAICATGISLMFGEMGGGAKKLIGICCGGAIVAAAVSWGPGFFNFSGSCLMV